MNETQNKPVPVLSHALLFTQSSPRGASEQYWIDPAIKHMENVNYAYLWALQIPQNLPPLQIDKQ